MEAKLVESVLHVDNYPQKLREVTVKALAATSALLIALIGAGACSAQEAASASPAPEPSSQAERLSDGVWLVEGGIRPGRQPDGNTVVFAGDSGLIVVDTGRHDWHRVGIEGLLAAKNQPLSAIINTHWHLDHMVGNLELKRQFPQATVYASNAMDQALETFLRPSAESSRQMLESQAPTLTPGQIEDIGIGVRATAAGDQLKPDVTVTESRERVIDGRRLDVRLATHAVTDGDLWLYDTASRTAVVGDLVTLPSPFMDTSCTKGWLDALDAVAATPFAWVIPGHGRPMDRPAFERYRSAFVAVIDCSKTDQPANACAEAWAVSVEPLLGEDPRQRRMAVAMTSYYVGDVLRANNGDSAFCNANAATSAS